MEAKARSPSRWWHDGSRVESWRSSRRTALILHGLDLPFIAVVALGVAATLGLEPRATLLPWLSFSGLRVLIITGLLFRELAPVDTWERLEGEARAAALPAANLALARSPTRAAIAYGICWHLAMALSVIWVWFVPERPLIGWSDVFALEFVGLAALFGAGSFGGPILHMSVHRQREAVSRELAEQSLAPRVGRLSLAQHLALYLSCILITGAVLVAAPSWRNHVDFERYMSVTELSVELEREAERLAQGQALERARVVEAAELPPETPSAVKDLIPPVPARVSIDRRAARAALSLELDGGQALVLEGPLEGDDGYGLALGVFAIVILLYGPLTIYLLLRSLVTPLRSLEAFVRRMTDVGDLSKLEHLPVIQYDEIGHLTRGVNELVERLQSLAGAALAVSSGELRVEIEARGELGESFLAMVAQLDEIVAQIRVTSVEVASVASEIYAASQRQEEAAGRSATTVTSVSTTVRSLADAAERITGSADEVLGAAARGSQTADLMVERIDALTTFASGISDLVDQIREIADRSDLLALNGSLEATRAGEAGRGFALVASEMRRLAERVTATVTDVRTRIAEIEAAGAAARQASNATREVSTQTASLAGDIAQQTRRQRDETEVASEAIISMADFITAASVSTSQTREAAGALRGRVDELERLVKQFNTRATPMPIDEQD